jgi:hypothetical protein
MPAERACATTSAIAKMSSTRAARSPALDHDALADSLQPGHLSPALDPIKAVTSDSAALRLEALAAALPLWIRYQISDTALTSAPIHQRPPGSERRSAEWGSHACETQNWHVRSKRPPPPSKGHLVSAFWTAGTRDHERQSGFPGLSLTSNKGRPSCPRN